MATTKLSYHTIQYFFKYRENATWQGKVIWAEKNKEQYFRSALELLKMMEDALDDANKDVSE